MRTSESVTEITKALQKAKAAFPKIVKGSQAYNFKYADLTTILEAVEPHLSANGISLIQGPFAAREGFLGVTTRLQHSSGEFFECDMEMDPRDVDKQNNPVHATPQDFGSAFTYARRYAVQAVLCLSAVDSDETTKPRQQRSSGGKSGGKGKMSGPVKKSNSLDF